MIKIVYGAMGTILAIVLLFSLSTPESWGGSWHAFLAGVGLACLGNLVGRCLAAFSILLVDMSRTGF